jgi:hypothetical protein
MADRNMPDRETDKDRLVSRPNEPLPTKQDPAGPESRGYPADPKPEPPPDGQGTDPDAGDVGHTV